VFAGCLALDTRAVERGADFAVAGNGHPPFGKGQDPPVAAREVEADARHEAQRIDAVGQARLHDAGGIEIEESERGRQQQRDAGRSGARLPDAPAEGQAVDLQHAPVCFIDAGSQFVRE